MFAAGNEYGHRFGFVEAGQIVKVAVLAKRVMYVAVAGTVRGAGNNGDIAFADLLHQAGAAFFEFALFHRLAA